MQDVQKVVYGFAYGLSGQTQSQLKIDGFVELNSCADNTQPLHLVSVKAWLGGQLNFMMDLVTMSLWVNTG